MFSYVSSVGHASRCRVWNRLEMYTTRTRALPPAVQSWGTVNTNLWNKRKPFPASSTGYGFQSVVWRFVGKGFSCYWYSRNNIVLRFIERAVNIKKVLKRRWSCLSPRDRRVDGCSHELHIF